MLKIKKICQSKQTMFGSRGYPREICGRATDSKKKQREVRPESSLTRETVSEPAQKEHSVPSKERDFKKNRDDKRRKKALSRVLNPNTHDDEEYAWRINEEFYERNEPLPHRRINIGKIVRRLTSDDP